MGWAVGPRANGKAGPTVLGVGARSHGATPRPVAGRNLLHSDQDSVYTSYKWLRQILLEDGLRVRYSERGAKDNPRVESVWGRVKTKAGSRIVEAQTVPELESAVDERFRYYNRRHHSRID